MNCPVCKQIALFPKDLEPDLSARECNLCGGRWIGSFQYWKWKEHSGKELTQSEPPQTTLPVTDSTAVKLCPECGHFLRRFPVGEGLRFSLDRCGNCGGMWLDRNEWESLKQHGLHDHAHKIFSEVWEHRIRQQEQTDAMEKIYRDKFGLEDYKRIAEIKEWIDNHPHPSELRAFLKL